MRLQGALAAITSRGVSLAAASTDTPADALRSRTEWQLSFPVLSLSDPRALEALGVSHPRGGPGGADVVVPTVLLLDRDGRLVRSYRAGRSVERLAPAAILAWIDGMEGAGISP